MSFLGQCTFRRLLSTTRRWPTSPSTPPVPAKPQPCYTWPIGPKPALRRRDRDAQTQLFDTLLFLLRSGAARDYGLGTRHDGYLSVRNLLNYPLFRSMDMLQLQEIVEKDPKYRFQLLFDPSRGDEAWWLRARLWDEKHMSLRPCKLTTETRIAVYQTNTEEWTNHIARSGISRHDGKYIHLVRHIPTNTYIDKFTNESQVFIFLNINKCIRSGLRFYHPIQTASHITESTPLVTEGNHLGLIPPHLFLRAQKVEATKSLLWGEAEAVPQRAWPEEPDDIDEHGRRKTMLPILKKNLHGFVDWYGGEGGNGSVHPETVKEAMEVAFIDM
ncbi:hypothetical protein GALMADRAFT_257980 [Galerina marginata CBS 339.88]|uniref:2'-phosphotransferase n=1 Tax=Galerina marginata (strain CBS 339.88) TaxID=685588 RepID=A0A067SA23_GALM3|nr:hypothetical protein GALMADRAFT_257980 [Galerina marginata CBS 339.88]